MNFDKCYEFASQICSPEVVRNITDNINEKIITFQLVAILCAILAFVSIIMMLRKGDKVYEALVAISILIFIMCCIMVYGNTELLRMYT